MSDPASKKQQDDRVLMYRDAYYKHQDEIEALKKDVVELRLQLDQKRKELIYFGKLYQALTSGTPEEVAKILSDMKYRGVKG